MSEALDAGIKEICLASNNDRTLMMDIVRSVQARFGVVSDEAIDLIAATIGVHRVEVESVVSFYAFLSTQPKGKVVVRACNDIIDKMKGADEVLEVLKKELGVEVGGTNGEGITLEEAPCIGMCDQAPAALVNDVVVTELNADKARQLVAALKAGQSPESLVAELGDGNNAHELVRAMVKNNIRETGAVVLSEFASGTALKKALAMTPQEVIREVKTSRVRGRGGAGFPAGLKWEFTRKAEGVPVVICNADEGEPGTFKDRVILTEAADLLFEGMTIGGYAVGADTGILYLRAEYAYLRAYLEKVLAERRAAGLLGKGIKAGFDFDIRIQMGAGAYICGEETALISSCEGLRGDPKNRPPFPAQKGYLGRPTTVNNVETFCAVGRVIEHGAGWFVQLGTPASSGTKLLSVSGDCARPGVYELEFGVTLKDFLAKVGGEDAIAIQVGGPSGRLVGPAEFGRAICYDDLGTGGSMMVFGPGRDLLKVVAAFLEFFVDESCGYCTPCRVGNTLLLERVERIIDGRGEPGDLSYLEELGKIIKVASRCGLGQTSANPVLNSLENFRALYEQRLRAADENGYQVGFDLMAAVKDAEAIAGRSSIHAE